MEEQKHYYAFISHSTVDENVALWLRKELEGYHIPSAVQRDYLSRAETIASDLSVSNGFGRNTIRGLTKQVAGGLPISDCHLLSFCSAIGLRK